MIDFLFTRTSDEFYSYLSSQNNSQSIYYILFYFEVIKYNQRYYAGGMYGFVHIFTWGRGVGRSDESFILSSVRVFYVKWMLVNRVLGGGARSTTLPAPAPGCHNGRCSTLKQCAVLIYSSYVTASLIGFPVACTVRLSAQRNLCKRSNCTVYR